MRKFIRSLLVRLSLLAGLGAAPGAWATTTLTFDDVPTGPLTAQYQGVGVTASGVDVVTAAFTSWQPSTPPNIAVAPTGLMTFTVDPAVIGNVQSVSVYIASGGGAIGLYAYDATNNLVGQAMSPGTANMALVSVTSSGNPISTVAIHDGGSTFAVDTMTFSTDVSFAKYSATVYLAPKLASFSATETFSLGTTSTGLNPSAQAVTLTFGTLTLSIPAGSFVKDMPPRRSSYIYQGTVNGGTLYVSITPTKTPNTYQLFALGAGYAFPSGLTAMPVSLSIGDNDGSTNLTPNYVTRVPTSP